MIKRVKVFAYGPRVQRVGYRSRVKEIADELGIVGTVRNVEDGTVEIICEGEEQVLTNFLKKVIIQEKEGRPFFPAIWVDGLDEGKPPAGQFKNFLKKNVTMEDSLEDMSHEVEIARNIMTNMAQSQATSTTTLIEINKNQQKTYESIDILTDHTDKNFTNMESKYHHISIVSYALLITISSFAVFGTLLYLNAIPKSMASFTPVLALNVAVWAGIAYLTIKKRNAATTLKNVQK